MLMNFVFGGIVSSLVLSWDLSWLVWPLVVG